MTATKTVQLVRRDDIPSMRTVTVDGVEHWLGHVKDFTKDPTLVNFLPKDNRISIAWVRLEAGEQLDEHTHPVDSLILICEGGAKTLGEVQSEMSAGDALIVPPGRPHGFQGAHPNGFWGLSLQFDSRGLYEEISDPWATFTLDESQLDFTTTNIAEELFVRNESYMERFDKHRLFALVNKGLLSTEQSRSRFLDCFQVWSDYFQKMVLTRVTTLQESDFEELAWSHLLEELGHNRELAISRNNGQRVFDPVLEASSAWFANIMSSISDAEKVVLVHLVVEASATFFYKHIQPAMETSSTHKHFTAHEVDDDGHVKMGYDFLRQYPLKDKQPLLDIQDKGWSMLHVVMSRIADLVVHFQDAKPIAATKDQQSKSRESEVEYS